MMSILEGRTNRIATSNGLRNVELIPGIIVTHPPRQSA